MSTPPLIAHGPTRGALWGLLMVTVMMFGLTLFNWWYTNHQLQQQCDAINAVVAAAKATPPTTAFGRGIVKSYQHQQRSFHC